MLKLIVLKNNGDVNGEFGLGQDKYAASEGPFNT